LITVRTNGYREDFLPMLLQRDTMKSFLKSLAVCSDETKVRHILPILVSVFSVEKVQDLYQKQIELEPEILRVIQTYHNRKKDENGSSDNIFNIPTVPLNELSTYLGKMIEMSGNSTDFTTDVALIISRSLQNDVKINDTIYLNSIKSVLISYGWSDDMDGFVVALTKDGLESLLAAMNDVFQTKQTSKSTNQASTEPTMYSDYNISTKDDNQNQNLLYNYTHWLVDRPLAPISQPVQRFIDILRHRLKIMPMSLTSTTTAPVGNPSSVLQGWGKKKIVAPRVAVAQQDGNGATAASASFVSPSCSQYQTIYDVLIHIISYSDLLSQIELFRLLIERRTAIPIIIPSLNFAAQPYSYPINALSFVNTKLSGQREYNLASDCSLLRIALLSMRPLQQSEGSEWMKQVFSCHSLVLLSSTEIQSIRTDQCIAEIGVGFIPYSTDVGSRETYREVLILNVIGNYSSIWPYIDQFADVLMIEEDPSNEKSFQPLTSLNENCRVITWKTATKKIKPYITNDGFYHLSSSVIQTVSDIQSSLLELLSHEPSTTQRSSLISMTHPNLYLSARINLINTEKIVQEQNYSKVRVAELPLQQLFMKESENITLKNRNKNNDAEQQRIQRLIDDCRRQRGEKAYDVEKHPLIKCLTGVLSLENRQLRTLLIHQLIQQIELHSRSAMKTLIDWKDEAFNEYDHDQQNTFKQKAYFDAKRLFADSIVGIEHFWREICHLYASNPTRYENYPVLAAKHLIDGFSLELLDGDAGMLEQTWIKAVFVQIEQQLMKQRNAESNKQPIRIFILSILGVQSTGKSTLLNLMFGTRLRTSAGMCTRGVNIQLLKAENRKEYDYILILDTEGIRAPEHTGLADAAWRDNRIATFAVLPADATIILINSEDDSAAREVLPIVMVAYQQSELAASSTSQLSTRIFFVYTRVDMNDTRKLVNNVQSMFMHLKTNANKLQEDDGNQNNQKANDLLFRYFRVNAENGEVGGAESDIKFLGKLKKSDVPPDDVPDTDYGDSVIQLNEYIYSRVVSKNADGKQWKARELKTFGPYLDSIWQCILSADFTLSFKTVMERRTYNHLQAYCISQRTKLAHLFSTAYDEIEKEIIGEQLPDQQTKLNEQKEKEMCKERIDRHQSDLSRLVDVQANAINKEVLEQLKDEVCLYQ
jgi:hypothetical protein